MSIQASYAFGSAAAAYTGSTGGLFVNVSKTSPDAWDIELQVRHMRSLPSSRTRYPVPMISALYSSSRTK